VARAITVLLIVTTAAAVTCDCDAVEIATNHHGHCGR
jgi:hypothetical protein